MTRIAGLLYLMLPVYAANMAPPFIRFWRGWNPPIDRRRLGVHKTVLGFVVGVLAGTATAALQNALSWHGNLVDYSAWPALGPACGFGAMAGDSLKSFFKRRRGIAPGVRWIPADQLDFVVGGLLALSFWIRLPWPDVLLILAVSFVGDIAVNQLAFRLGIRTTAW